ncbi:hypothetical protein [Pseudooctadecabacter jejudonensis]|uniref:Uncharacterized protein n=1 Tax=Pseudooctadecabacter jejudonensis TaxID=1391910 RepID=A0A1Y5RPT4_9RHOB|nr:hypothetical protein [Pseudooctadecabacter jejudonensis]SLN22581.1 hypothetical protein PSJ8397_00923 [Pseudooctadecabacter jejudonensis]
MRLIFPLLFCANATWADCGASAELFMSCDFGNGKTITVCTDGNIVDYSFGVSGQSPELAISLAYQEGAEKVPWTGVGRSIWEAIRLTNNDVTYEVYAGFDRFLAADDTKTLAEVFFGGIVVEDFDGTELAHLRCDPATVNYGY